MKPQPGCRILDIVCGPGTVAPYFHDVEYVGFDSSPEYIESARRQFPRLTFVCARVNQYQPQREYFDVALALGVVHHLDDDEALQLFQMVQAALRYISHFMATTYPIMWLKRHAAAWRIGLIPRHKRAIFSSPNCGRCRF